MTTRLLKCSMMALFSIMLALPAQAVQRKVLLEGFTQWNCPPCATWNPQERAVLNAMTRDTVVCIKYHCYWPAPNDDAFYLWNTSENGARISFYGVSAIPRGYLDGSQITESQSWLTNAIRARRNVSSPVAIATSAWTSGSTSVGFCIEVSAEQAIIGSSYRLFVVLITDLIQYASPPGDNGETRFDNIFRDMAPSASGFTISLNAGQSQSFMGTLNREASWDPNNLSVIAFVQNTSTREVLQAAWCDVLTTAPSIPAPDDLVINLSEFEDGMRITWSHVNQNSMGCPLSNRSYVIYRSVIPDFVPQPADCLSSTPDSTYNDIRAFFGEKYFYRVKVKTQ